MEIIKLKKNIKIPQSVIALGFFDGVHLGHQKVIKTAVSYSKIFNIPSLVFTFKDSPKKKVLKEHSLILPFEEKVCRTKVLGVDYIIWADFDKKISELSPNDFVKKILVDTFHARLVIVGFNYHFGHNAKGTVNDLVDLGRKYGFQVEIILPCKSNGKTVSSTFIKELITKGAVAEANSLLDYMFCVKGKVVRGRGIGADKLKILTANINWPKDIVKLPLGVYAVLVKYDNKIYKGVSNLGFSPTIGKKEVTLEVNIFNFKKNIYSEKLQVFFVDRIRNEEKFANIEELKKQIKKDIKKSKKILAESHKRAK